MTEPAPPEITTPAQIQQLAGAFQRSRVLLTAFELEVFTIIEDGALPSEEVAARTGADPRGVDRLLNALCVLGLLRKEGDRFRNTAVAARHLVRGREGYLAQLGHSANFFANLFARWATLTDAVRTGGTVLRPAEAEGKAESFIAAMHRRARESAGEIASLLELGGVRRVLDVGGGSGVYSMAFCRAEPGLEAVVLDLPRVAALTRGYVEAAGLAGRIAVAEGDFLKTPFGGGFDLVFFSAIVHMNSPGENALLMEKAFAALRPGGRIAVQDFVMDGSRTRPPMGALFALNMLVNTPRGDAYTEDEIRGWLARAGCGKIRRVDTGPATAMIVGWKAGA